MLSENSLGHATQLVRHHSLHRHGTILSFLLAVTTLTGCELQVVHTGDVTTYGQSIAPFLFGVFAGLALLVGGVFLFTRTQLPFSVRRYGVAGAAIGLLFIVLGAGVVGTYVEVTPGSLRGRTGAMWDRYEYDIAFDELVSIELYTEKVEPTSGDGTEVIPASFFRFAYKSGETLEVKKDGYLKGAQEQFFDFAREQGVSINVRR